MSASLESEIHFRACRGWGSALLVGIQAARPHDGHFGQPAQQFVLVQAELKQFPSFRVQVEAVRDPLQRALIPRQKRRGRPRDDAALRQDKILPVLQPPGAGRADIIQSQTVFVVGIGLQLAEQGVYAVEVTQQAVDFPQLTSKAEKADAQQEHQAQLHQIGRFDNGPDRHAFLPPTAMARSLSTVFLMSLA